MAVVGHGIGGLNQALANLAEQMGGKDLSGKTDAGGSVTVSGTDSPGEDQDGKGTGSITPHNGNNAQILGANGDPAKAADAASPVEEKQTTVSTQGLVATLTGTAFEVVNKGMGVEPMNLGHDMSVGGLGGETLAVQGPAITDVVGGDAQGPAQTSTLAGDAPPLPTGPGLAEGAPPSVDPNLPKTVSPDGLAVAP